MRSFRQFTHKEHSLASTPNLTVEKRNYLNLVTKGKSYYQNNQMPQAIEHFSRSLYFDPACPEVNYLLAVAYIATQQCPKALSHLRNLPQDAYKSSASMLTAIAHKKLNQLSESLAAINKHIQANQDLQGYFYRAKLHFHSKQYAHSLDDIHTILQANPNHSPTLILKLRCLRASNLPEDCLRFIQESVHLLAEQTTRTDMMIEGTRIHMQLRQYEAALIMLNRIRPHTSRVALLRGKIFQLLGRDGEAIMEFNEVLSKTEGASEDFNSAICQASIHYMRQRDFYESFSYLRRSSNRGRPRSMECLYKLAEGVTFLMKKKCAEAIVLLGSLDRASFGLLPDHCCFLSNLYYSSLAYAYFSLGDHKQALQLYGSMEIGDEPPVRYNMCLCEGIIRHEEGKKEEALASFQRANGYLLRPEPYFYSAVILNEQMSTENLMKVLSIIEEGLKAGESAHMYYYRSVIYLFLGMSAEALEDIDRAIDKSEDNVARYFHVRGAIFMLDHNYQQAVAEFSVALSIDDTFPDSLLERAKCFLLSGDSANAYDDLQQSPNFPTWAVLFTLHQRNYEQVLAMESAEERVKEIAHFMLGQFEAAGPSGKLILATVYHNYREVCKLIDEALSISVTVGCLDSSDLLFLKGYCHSQLQEFHAALQCYHTLELNLSHDKNGEYSQDDEQRLLVCKVNAILVHLKAGEKQQAQELVRTLLEELCDGPAYQQLHTLHAHLLSSTPFALKLFDVPSISDYLPEDEACSILFRIVIPFPNYRVSEVESPDYQHLLTEMTLRDVDNKPEPPWILRGEYGVIFTNQVQEFEHLNLQTEEAEISRHKMAEDLRLGSAVLSKLEKMEREKA